MLLFLLALLQTAGPTAPASPEVFADILTYQGLSDEVWAESNVEMRVVNGRLTAQRLSASQKTGWFSAQGHVVIRWADAVSQWVVLADWVQIRLKPREEELGEGARGGIGGIPETHSAAYEVEEIFLNNGLWVQKHELKASVLLEAKANEVLKIGKNGLGMRLEHMRQNNGSWEFRSVGFVPCDCDTTNPSWHLESHKGTLDIEGQRAYLTSTVAYIDKVPFFWLPWISLPLSSRQTGLLFPSFSSSVNSGFSPKLPVFITLGRSADLTLTPGWTMGTQNFFGVRGPSLGTEFRYALSEKTKGNVGVDWLWDFKEQRSPVNASYTGEEGAPKKQRGLRFGTRLNHRQSIGEYGQVLANVNVASDGYLHSDFESDLILKSIEYTRSQLGFSYEGPRVDVLLEVGYLQDIRWGYPLLGTAPLLAPADPRRGPNTLQRFPALSLTLREQPLGQGFSFVMQSSFVRLAPWRGLSGDEGPDAREGDDRIWREGRWETLSIQCMRARLYQPYWNADVCPADMPVLWGKAFQGDGLHQPGEREARDRLGVLPTLKYQKRFLGGGAGIAASLSLREDIWLGELSGRWFSRGYPLLRLQADGTLAKEVKEGFWHSLTPQAQLRWVAAQWGKAPVGYDEADLAIPRGYRGLEFAVGLRQSLWKRGASTTEELLSLEIAQAVGVAAGEPGARLGDAFLRFASRWRFLEPDVYAYFDSKQGQFSRFGSTVRAQWPSKLGGHIQYDLFQMEGGEWSRRGMDMLIGLRPPLSKSTHHLGMGAWGRVESFSFRYQISFFELGEKFRFAQHSLGIGWIPACNCFGFELYALQTVVLNERGQYGLGMPNIGFSFQLQGLGGWGMQK